MTLIISDAFARKGKVFPAHCFDALRKIDCEIKRQDQEISSLKALSSKPGASIFAKHAWTCIERGYNPITRPFCNNWSAYCEVEPSAAEIEHYNRIRPKAGIALACGDGGFVAVDLDVDGQQYREALLAALPKGDLMARHGSKAMALLFRHKSGRPIKGFTIKNEAGQVLVEVLGLGANVTIPPSIHHETNRPYVWIDAATGESIEMELPPLWEMPTISDAHFDKIRQAFAPWAAKPREFKARPRSTAKANATEGGRLKSWAISALDGKARDLAQVKEGGRNRALNDAVYSLGWAIRERHLSEREVCDAMRAACQENGYIRSHGRNAFERTFDSGLRAGMANCEPPQLEDRPIKPKRQLKVVGGTDAAEDLSSCDAQAAKPDARDLPAIYIKGGSLHANANEAELHLKAAGVPIYRQRGVLVRPARVALRDAKGDEVQIAAVCEMSATGLRDELCKHIEWYKYDARSEKWLRKDAPADVAEIILSRVEGGPWPALASVSATPFIRRDGGIVSNSGFDDRTGTFLLDPVKLPAMPESPSIMDARKALEALDALLSEFPFVDAASKSVALSALLTPLARHAVNVVPMHVATAPAAGTGKSYLFDLTSAIVNGVNCPVISFGKNEEEMEKRLGARILAGNPLTSIDNVNGILSGDLLCQAISQEVISPRILGLSKCPDITNRFTLFANGNNIRIHGDLTRRVPICSMDAKVEATYKRNFQRDPLKEVLANRGFYIAACLTILRAHALAGFPGVAKLEPYNGFKEWSKMVRGALVWLGMADPVTTIGATEDPQKADRLGFMQALAALFGTGRDTAVTVAEMVQARMASSGDTAEMAEARATLTAYLARFKRKGDIVDPSAVGTWLNGFKDTICDGMRLEGRKLGKNKTGWFVAPLDAATHDSEDCPF